MPDYLQHGSRHRPDGTDPIPGLGSSVFPFIVANGSVIVSSSPASSHYVDLSLYATSDSSVFSVALGTGGLSAVHGVTISEAGVYRAWFDFEFSGATNGDTLIAEAAGSLGGTFSHWAFSNTNQKDDTRVVYSTTALTGAAKVQYSRVIYAGGVFDPSSSFPEGFFVSGRSPAALNFTLTANVLVEQLSTSYTTNGSFGSWP